MVLMSPSRSRHVHASRSSIDTTPAAPARAISIVPLTIPLQIHSDPLPTRPTASRNLSYDAGNGNVPAPVFHPPQGPPKPPVQPVVQPYPFYKGLRRRPALRHPCSCTSTCPILVGLIFIARTNGIPHVEHFTPIIVEAAMDTGAPPPPSPPPALPVPCLSVLNRDGRSPNGLNGINDCGDGRHLALGSECESEAIRTAQIPSITIGVGGLNELNGDGRLVAATACGSGGKAPGGGSAGTHLGAPGTGTRIATGHEGGPESRPRPGHSPVSSSRPTHRTHHQRIASRGVLRHLQCITVAAAASIVSVIRISISFPADTRKISALRKKKFVGKAEHCSSMYEYRGSFQAFSALIFHGFFTLPIPAIAISTTTSPPTGRTGPLPYLLLSAAIHSFLDAVAHFLYV
ncbi:hypothetical protein D9619_009471 [Psilocybe cf. subviscida]|uniref:Uncharacterized protein n=1 Tax=Psilocybe cf. subviscida TaxID=2480587 RepID=A0A8H5BU16_9AGAR|nr:hypothetical protein D9619_009471 [Psilocybe cf. subviscida]